MARSNRENKDPAQAELNAISTLICGDDGKAYCCDVLSREVESLIQERDILKTRVRWLQLKAGIKDDRP